jgi:paired amphipathic helix protein Sin3a
LLLRNCCAAGTNSYTLFTLDKLIYKIVKHLQVILADEVSMKLAELYKYEQSRGSKEGTVMEAVYYQNAHILLHEDPTFRFESLKDGRFTIQLLDTDRSEVPAGKYNLPPSADGYSGYKHWQKYGEVIIS